MYPIKLASHSSQVHPPISPPPQKEKRKNTQVQFVLPLYSLEHGQSSCGQPLKNT